jgi:hypothetical protein
MPLPTIKQSLPAKWAKIIGGGNILRGSIYAPADVTSAGGGRIQILQVCRQAAQLPVVGDQIELTLLTAPH